MTDKTPKQRDIHTMSQNKSKAWWDRVFSKVKPELKIVKKDVSIDDQCIWAACGQARTEGGTLCDAHRKYHREQYNKTVKETK